MSYCLISGNKLDLEDKREVSYEEGLQFAEKYNFMFFETSAKINENVSCVFEDAVKEYTNTYYPRYEQQKEDRF